MPTDTPDSVPTSVFLLAHQDDEFGVFHAIESEKKLGRRVVCAYLTSGVGPGGDPSQRDAESMGVLSALGVDEVIFAGAQIGVADGHLRKSLPVAGQWMDQFLGARASLEMICVPAWEGGHPDHDCLHAIAVETALRQGKGRLIRQFSLYNGRGCPGPFFHVLKPLEVNGVVQKQRIPLPKRIRYLQFLLRYRSQFKTWVGLMPFVLVHYIVKGTQDLQEVNASRVRERPHDGRLYYEKRQFARWEEVSAAIAAWQSAQHA